MLRSAATRSRRDQSAWVTRRKRDGSSSPAPPKPLPDAAGESEMRLPEVESDRSCPLPSPRNPANDIDDVVTERLAALIGLASVVARLAARLERLEKELEILRRGDPDQLLGTEQAAQLLGMSEAAVRQAARRGSLPAEHRGRSLRFRRGALLASTGIQRRMHRVAAGAANPNA